MKQYKLLNNLFGWIAFAVAAFTYLSTVEPTASFWDCPEFITCAAKGEVGHPPGNTFFNLTGRFFVNFAGGDMTQAAVWVNRMSALFSAATILFLFWTITALTKKIVCKRDEEMTMAQMIAILGSGLVGSLLYTFTDTFWFSAVEGEVYAFSSMMTALVFWLILKWETHAERADSDRYIILLAYIIGLSIGVHLLNLLCIPAIVLVYYFKKNPNAKLRGTLGALALSMVMVGLILYGLIPGFVKLASATELLFVNTFGCPYNTGTAVYFFFILALLVWGISVMYRRKASDRAMRVALTAGVVLSGVPFVGDSWLVGIVVAIILGAIIFLWKGLNVRLASNVLFSLLVILIGYSTFAQIIIRSSANLPMNQNAPDEIFSFTKYLNREQYGDRPLFYGQSFVSDVERDAQGRAVTKQGAPIYSKVVKKDPSEPDRYYISGYKEDYVYNHELNMIFPRMYSKQDGHPDAYKEWSNFTGRKVRVKQGNETRTVTAPTFGDNLQFFFRYQLNFMYWRYFLWNFSGRQSDVQSYGEVDRGNWITGIPVIDRMLVGDQDMPASIANNKGHNVYYMLPLILGLIGLFYQAYAGQRGIQGFWVVFFLFFMTGIAIVIYLNQTPYQPRERDYAYAGSFYAFSIWIGMGVAGLFTWVTRLMKQERAWAAALVSVVCLLVPLQMAGQNWDDHDRSNRYTARDFGRNYLTSLEPNAIIFTNGDNDTFPLWYAQEVEGYRTDVRVCNLSYLQTDWYINQMKSQAYESEPLPIALRPDQYAQDKLNFAHLVKLQEEMPLSDALQYFYSDDPKYKRIPGYSDVVDYLPTSRFTLEIDSAAVASSPVFDLGDQEPVKTMTINLTGRSYVTKNEIAILSMIDGINADGWKRPIYFATTVGSNMYMGLNPYFRLVGLAYQIAPITGGGTQTADVDRLYDNMMNKFVWGNIDDPNIYLDENNRRMSRTLRMMFGTLIEQLNTQGDTVRAAAAAEFCNKQIPSYNVPNDYTSLSLAQALYLGGKNETAREIVTDLLQNTDDYLSWAFRLNKSQMLSINRTIREDLLIMRDALAIAQRYHDDDLVKAYNDKFERHFQKAYNTYKLLN
jgi:hypothetical protein